MEQPATSAALHSALDDYDKAPSHEGIDRIHALVSADAHSLNDRRLAQWIAKNKQAIHEWIERREARRGR